MKYISSAVHAQVMPVNSRSWASQVALVIKEPTCQCRRRKRRRFGPWVRKIPWRRARQPTPVFLPGESHGQRSLAGHSRWGCKAGQNCSKLAHVVIFILQVAVQSSIGVGPLWTPKPASAQDPCTTEWWSICMSLHTSSSVLYYFFQFYWDIIDTQPCI